MGSYQIVSAAFSDLVPGAAEYIKGKTLIGASLEEAAVRTLTKNLLIRFQEKNLEKLAAGIPRAQSAFDPVLSLSVNFLQTDTYPRKAFINRTRFSGRRLEEEFERFDQAFENTFPPSIIIVDGVNVTELAGIQIRPLIAEPDFDVASFRSKNLTETITAKVVQQFPWGPTLEVSLSEVHTKDRLPVNDTLHRRWTSNFSLTVTLPVPWCKDFGPYGPSDTSIKLAKKSREKAFWELQSAINSSMQGVVVGYWELVRAIRRLEITVLTRKNLEEIAKQSERLLEAGRSTAYEKNQVLAEVARIRGQEQDAWSAYVLASNALKNLLDYDKDAVLLPTRYSNRLGKEMPYSADDAVRSAMENSPEVKASQIEVALSEIALKFSKNQARPDLKIVSGVSTAQNSAPFGYRTIGRSMGAFHRGDSKNEFVLLTYHVPWGNKPALAEVDQADQRYLQAERIAGRVVNLVEKGVADSLAALATTKRRVAHTLKSKETAERIYATVLDLWEKGRVPELEKGKSNPAFEILSKNTDMLSARLSHIDAQAELKQAEASLLAAQGILASRCSSDLEIQVKPTATPPAPEGKKDDAPKVKGADGKAGEEAPK